MMTAAADSSPLTLGPRVLEDYEPLGVIGHGGYATVFKARHLRDGSIVAVKHFRGRNGTRHRYFHEMRFVLRLRHPNIVRCLSLYDGDGDSGDLILEYADQGSLRERIFESVPNDARTCVRVGRQMAQALQYAHELGIVHRDLKPENILVFGGGQSTYKLADFGIAKYVGIHNRTATSIGTPCYMAPEQFYDEYGTASDIYALGVVLFEMSQGRVPFDGSPVELFRAHQEAEIEFDVDIRDDLAELIRNMTNKEPDKRPDAARALREFDEIARTMGMYETPGHTTPPAPDQAGPRNAGALFADFFGGDNPKDEPKDDPSQAGENGEVPGPRGTNAQDRTPAPPKERATAGNPFGDFVQGLGEDSRVMRLDVVTDLKELSKRRYEETFGILSISRQWSRAVDSGTMNVVNLDNGANQLCITSGAIFEMLPEGRRGDEIFSGPIERAGTPSQGKLPFMSGGRLRVLSHRMILPSAWDMEGELDQIVLAPNLSSVAATIGSTIYMHDGRGESLWSGSYEGEAEEIFISFDGPGRLMVVPLGSDDQTVYFYNDEGRVISTHWLPGRIQGAARCRARSGAWVSVRRRSGFELLRVGAEGFVPACRMDTPLTDLVGGEGWVCGLDAEHALRVVDPATGATATAPVKGGIVAYEQGRTADQLCVLERRDEILKYVTAFSIRAELTNPDRASD